MLIPNKRAWMAARLRDVGVLRLLERVARGPALVVLVYHRIGYADRQPFYAPLFSATPESFETQLQFLKNRYRIISLDALLAAVDDAGDLHVSEPTALVTFDDGYRDNLIVAAPILQRLRMPATLFVTTGFLTDSHVPWWDQVACVINSTANLTLALDRPKPVELVIDPDDRTDAISTVIGAYIDAGWHATDDELCHLRERAGVNRQAVESQAKDLFLNWAELRQLVDLGWSIGAHSQTHRRLGSMSEQDQLRELSDPKASLERALGSPIHTFAYPYGNAGAYTATTEQLARTAGYRLAFSLNPRVLRAGTLALYQIPRFVIGPSDSMAMLRARLVLNQLAGRSFV